MQTVCTPLSIQAITCDKTKPVKYAKTALMEESESNIE